MFRSVTEVSDLSPIAVCKPRHPKTARRKADLYGLSMTKVTVPRRTELSRYSEMKNRFRNSLLRLTKTNLKMWYVEWKPMRNGVVGHELLRKQHEVLQIGNIMSATKKYNTSLFFLITFLSKVC